MYELGIELSIRDVQLIYKIKEVLGIGTILFRDRKAINKEIKNNINYIEQGNCRKMVIYRIRNKSHLKNIIIPIFDKYPFFTIKQYDYIRFKNLLLKNVIYSKDLASYIRPNIPLNSVEYITESSYFPA
jgi:LAGLIDADG endonuclease